MRQLVKTVVCSLVFHVLGFAFARFILQHLLPRLVDIFLAGPPNEIGREGGHHKKPVFGNAMLIICRNQIERNSERCTKLTAVFDTFH